ncbi:glycosyltransferase family 2 protein [Methylomonas sp. MED-D]|uniref:glycosyltransferase family 2 protein n=1 Tax=unclassified Methylomonas TaxID=2608980 RepID=UPI0008D9006F|nr:MULTISPECIES: glycosyltransferase family 2 protein [unclassified Methylomonas]MDT4331162.1 glycosyltransferase family 2 protein [Methylomonas sp. MV1]NJA08307.1 glycosyltransferase family 2 protein [Methylococcaceae bacterium WWC4]OHX37784.1 glycosyl transferase family 2 [Methylomonas sp. LWB]WGS84688.1 glycosyltransferase family 2 protein [Methylomonas sp. UP202]
MRIAVVIPCYKTGAEVLRVLTRIGPQVSAIYLVDDACPERTADWVEQHLSDPRLRILRHAKNQGVGGAVISGIRAALADHTDIIVKIDGDGQMDPALIDKFVEPIRLGRADYCKGNRFYRLDYLHGMPTLRLLGNTLLSFIAKMSTGYWNIMDPTNGYVAIHAKIAEELPLDKLSRRFFFESDLLFRLNVMRAVVEDVPMRAVYANEVSNLSIGRIVFEFSGLYLNRFFKRLFYSYFLRGFNAASIMFISGSILFGGGALFGAWHWYHNSMAGVLSSAGTVMLAVLPIVLGFQLLLGAIQIDIQSEPRLPIHGKL